MDKQNLWQEAFAAAERVDAPGAGERSATERRATA